METPGPTDVLHLTVDGVGVEVPDGLPMTHQERAYTSPIWYEPAS